MNSEHTAEPAHRGTLGSEAGASVIGPHLQSDTVVGFFDYLKVPYLRAYSAYTEPERDDLRAWQRVSFADGRRHWYWPPSDGDVRLRPATLLRLGRVPVYAGVLPYDTARDWLAGLGSWRPRELLRDADGEVVSAVWEEADGSVLLPFDPDEAILAYWSEAYQGVDGSATAVVRRRTMDLYYQVRPLLPRRLQIALRRAYSRIQSRTEFPRWPVETGLHDLFDWLLGTAAELADAPLPWIAPWPDGYRWAVVLTHDVETEFGYRSMDLLKAIEERHGLRSAWNFVPKRYRVEDTTVAGLHDSGFEVGVHGLHHDGRDLEPGVVEARLPTMQQYARRWNARGFRSPATHRDWELMPRLGFDYDSSYPDTDPFEPQGGGCGSWLPFHNEGMVELPITLPQDHTLFVILGHSDERLWQEKADVLRQAGGMALLITHPDYMTDRSRLDAYDRFLHRVRSNEDAWVALPRDVADWWQRRADSRLEQVDGSWRVAGPAAGEARVTVTSGEVRR